MYVVHALAASAMQSNIIDWIIVALCQYVVGSCHDQSATNYLTRRLMVWMRLRALYY
jgi:hypothetical protein